MQTQNCSGGPGTIYGALLNYREELAALGDQVNQAPYKAPPQAPILYIKTANTKSVDGAAIAMPAGVDALWMGAALGLVIGKTACRVPASQALDYVSGYRVINDVSVPHASYYRPAVRHKCRDGFCPLGPEVARDALADPDALAVRVYINDKLEQENTTANLVRPVAKLLADVTEFMTLFPGDILLVGLPENPPLARIGDRVVVEIEQVGRLHNTVAAEQQIKGANA
jgi:5-oxopent-3-ene-1,2,5-tricarboxylate decarboxylase/2-hydroxyhepta-2,4-diene-1,7-dioate isomerase